MFARYNLLMIIGLFFSVNTVLAMNGTNADWGKAAMHVSPQDVLDIDQAFAKLKLSPRDSGCDKEVDAILSKVASSSSNHNPERVAQTTVSDEQFRYEMGRRTVARELEEKEGSLEDLAVVLFESDNLPESGLMLKRKESTFKEQALKLVAGTLFRKPRTPKNFRSEELAFEHYSQILAEATMVNSVAALRIARLLKHANANNPMQATTSAN